MVTLTQRFPNFVDHRDPFKVAEISKAEDLLQVEWIAQWKHKHPNFYRFSQNNDLLMAELDGGAKWWAIAWIADGPIPDLPQWVHPRRG